MLVGSILSVVTGPADDVLRRLEQAQVAWLCTLRRDGSPHLTPVWFWFCDGIWWVSSAAHNVKVGNIAADTRVSLALPEGNCPVVAEGTAVIHRHSVPVDVVAAFADKYQGWDITDEEREGPRVLIEVSVSRWLLTGTAR